jgi:hypothetical protein
MLWSTSGAFVNWMSRYSTTSMRFPQGSRKSKKISFKERGPGSTREVPHMRAIINDKPEIVRTQRLERLRWQIAAVSVMDEMKW